MHVSRRLFYFVPLFFVAASPSLEMRRTERERKGSRKGGEGVSVKRNPILISGCGSTVAINARPNGKRACGRVERIVCRPVEWTGVPLARGSGPQSRRL